MELELDVIIKPRSMSSPEPFVTQYHEMIRNSRRCDCGKIYAIHYRPQDDLKAFMAALRIAVLEEMRVNGQTRPFVGNLSLQVIVYRPRPQSHYKHDERGQEIKEGRDDSNPMVIPYLHLVMVAVINSLNGEVLSDIRQLSQEAIKDVWGDEDRLKILVKTVKTGEIDDRFKQQDLDFFDLEC